MEVGLAAQGRPFGLGRASGVDHKMQHVAKEPQPEVDWAGNQDFHWTSNVFRLK
jgi:hypothetical protein